jgi:hypothetical protein
MRWPRYGFDLRSESGHLAVTVYRGSGLAVWFLRWPVRRVV